MPYGTSVHRIVMHSNGVANFHSHLHFRVETISNRFSGDQVERWREGAERTTRIERRASQEARLPI